jgi:hypothetical protein
MAERVRPRVLAARLGDDAVAVGAAVAARGAG